VLQRSWRTTISVNRAPYHRRRTISDPSLTYPDTVYPDDVGLPADYGCMIWFAFHYSVIIDLLFQLY